MHSKKTLAAIVAFISFPLLSYAVLFALIRFMHYVMDMDLHTTKAWGHLIVPVCIAITALISFGIYRMIVGKDFDAVNRNFISKLFVGWMWGTGNTFTLFSKSNKKEDQPE